MSRAASAGRRRRQVGPGNRLVARMQAMQNSGQRGVAPYVTAGDGGLDTTLAVLRALEAAGASCVELGVPFSDPIADGPVLQAAADRSLSAGTHLDGILAMLRRFRAGGDGAPAGQMPVAVMSYANPLLRRGWMEVCRSIADAGGDALIVPDLPLEESKPVQAAADQAGLCLILLVAPTTSDERLQAAAESSRGFLYVVGRFGVTGGRTEFDDQTTAFLKRVRSVSRLPLAVGFGIANAQHVEAATRHAELAIVGSALVRHLHETASQGGDPAAAAARFLESLQQGLPA